MIERQLASLIVDRFSRYQFVTVSGPREVGKTTLCRNSLPQLSYANLELPEQREFATQDPNGFLATLGDQAIIDEIVRVPSLIPHLQSNGADEQSGRRYILICSESSETVERMCESPVGTSATLQLLPLTLSERERAGGSGALNDILYSGFYPKVHDRGVAPRKVLSDYFSTFLDRDVHRIGGVRDLASFELFARLCAGRISRAIDLVALGRDVGVSHTTARNWLRVLESTFIAFRLHPIQVNTRKRLVKSPRLYFYDVGLAAYLMGIETSDQITTHPLRGALFENMVVAEALKHRINKGKPANLTFFRDNHGLGCELLFGLRTSHAAIEIKSSATIPTGAFDSLNAIERALPDVTSKYVIYGGTVPESRGDVEVVPFDRVNDMMDSLEINRDTTSEEESRSAPTHSSLDSTRLNDAYAHWIKPLIQSLTTSMVEFQTMFGSISQLEFLEYGQNQVISPTLFSPETWESTKQDHLAISLDGLSEQEPLTLAHRVTLTGFSSTDHGELALEIRIEWTLTRHGLRQIVSIEGELMGDLNTDVVTYDKLASSSPPADVICAEVLNHFNARINRHTEQNA